jgi:hypothetical protein
MRALGSRFPPAVVSRLQVSRQLLSRVTFPKRALQWVHIDLSRFPLATSHFSTSLSRVPEERRI